MDIYFVIEHNERVLFHALVKKNLCGGTILSEIVVLIYYKIETFLFILQKSGYFRVDVLCLETSKKN